VICEKGQRRASGNSSVNSRMKREVQHSKSRERQSLHSRFRRIIPGEKELFSELEAATSATSVKRLWDGRPPRLDGMDRTFPNPRSADRMSPNPRKVIMCAPTANNAI